MKKRGRPLCPSSVIDLLVARPWTQVSREKPDHVYSSGSRKADKLRGLVSNPPTGTLSLVSHFIHPLVDADTTKMKKEGPPAASSVIDLLVARPWTQESRLWTDYVCSSGSRKPDKLN